jgi:hypothetical protein
MQLHPRTCRPGALCQKHSTHGVDLGFRDTQCCDAGILRPLLTSVGSQFEQSRGERTPRSIQIACFRLSYSHLFGTPLTSFVWVGFTR